jgi:hypothetical protein
MKELDQVLADMGRVLDDLGALGDDAFERRLQLLQEQKRLRVRAAELRATAPINREALEAELEGLLDRWDGIQDQRIDVVMQSGGGSQGGDAFSGAHAVRMNQEIDRALGREQIESRIAEIRRLLEASNNPGT